MNDEQIKQVRKLAGWNPGQHKAYDNCFTCFGVGVVPAKETGSGFEVCQCAKPGNVYYFLLRPPFIGTHPAGEVSREVWQPVQNIPGTERHAHGWVKYPAPLDFDQVWKYDLYPANEDGLNRYWDWREENNR
jgi:hypothetical protein